VALAKQNGRSSKTLLVGWLDSMRGIYFDFEIILSPRQFIPV
jgi:hypothetical protein